MKKINQKEFDNLSTVARGKKTSKFNIELSKCEVGTGFIITKKEWGKDRHPSEVFNNPNSYLKMHGITVRVKLLEDKTAWAVLRIK